MAWFASGISLVGGLIGADSARKAAGQQTAAAQQASDNSLAATRETNQLQAGLYKNGLAQNAPYQRTGQLALSALSNGLGLGYAKNPGLSGQGISMTPGGGAPAGTYTNAQGQPTDAQGNVIKNTSDPYGLAGINYGANDTELANAGNSVDAGYFTHQFDRNDFNNNVDAGYQFRLDQGNQGLNARRAATGNRLGSQALRDISDYNQGAASQEYGNAYSRYTNIQNNIFSRLSGLAGAGSSVGSANQGAGANVGQGIAGNTQTGVGNSNGYLTSGANAGAAGQIGSTNAIVGGINTGLNNYYTQQWLNKKP
jgi:hypothetical protein